MKRPSLIFTFSFLLMSMLYPQTIEEKKASFQGKVDPTSPVAKDSLRLINEQLKLQRLALQNVYDQAARLQIEGAPQEDFQPLVAEARASKEKLSETQQQWRQSLSSARPEEGYALWNQPMTTMGQIVADYGSQNYVYIIPPEVANLQISILSALPIPSESSDETLELILSQNGVGISQLNPYVRQLYLLKDNLSGAASIVSDPIQLELLPDHSRVVYLLTPPPPSIKKAWDFLSKFANPTTTTLRLIHRQIFIVASKEQVQELLKLYSFVDRSSTAQYRLVTLSRIPAKDMETILNTLIPKSIPQPLSPQHQQNRHMQDDDSSFKVLTLSHLPHSLFLLGSSEDLTHATQLINDIENQLHDPQEKVIYTYVCRHSEAAELADVLSHVYGLMVRSSMHLEGKGKASAQQAAPSSAASTPPPAQNPSTPPYLNTTAAYDPDQTAVTTASINTAFKAAAQKPPQNRNDAFIVDQKTGSVIMVVEQSALPKLRELIKKLDVPKRMVQIEVLLFEKKILDKSQIGLNLLKIGTAASNTHSNSLIWNDTSTSPANTGILQYLISRTKRSGVPAFDLAYQFLLNQENVQINASPSITTVNQTPAKIALVEEISINTGVIALDPTNVALKEAYVRSQYGITIEVTPTINMGWDKEEGDPDVTGFITLSTDITFDTTKPSVDNRPDVTRRHVNNVVRVADGQTVILGGLRRKDSISHKEMIPFLGELPGLGKLFSINRMLDVQTEMFVFLTPKIIGDPSADLDHIRQEQLKKRPGDIPEFLEVLIEAQRSEKHRVMERSLNLLLGKQEQPLNPLVAEGSHVG